MKEIIHYRGQLKKNIFQWYTVILTLIFYVNYSFDITSIKQQKSLYIKKNPAKKVKSLKYDRK